MSLLERLNVPTDSAPSIGPIRSKSGSRSSPYVRTAFLTPGLVVKE